jgi:release factor glutamine methyltransferase
MDLETYKHVYEPREDSWLLQEQLKTINNKKRILDIGTGTGIQAIQAALINPNAFVLATDLNFQASKLAKQNASANKTNIKIICSDLFSAIKPNYKFDLIIFNPPYLPEDPPLDPQWSGGSKFIDKFLEQAKQHLLPKGVIVFIYSSLSNIKSKAKILAKKELLAETIYAASITSND